MNIQPFYIIPLLIKQPTWGGSYIVETKQLLDPILRGLRIGQSYELSSDSRVSTDPATQDCFILTDSGLAEAQQFGPSTENYDLQSIVMMDPVAILGEAWAKKEPNLTLLIKFNQAKNNSYQVHIRPGNEFHGWQAKPETWYYLEDGKATLGLKQGVDVAEYKRCCVEIDAFSRDISRQIKEEELDVASAREQLATFIEEHSPRQFVNSVAVPRGSVVNLWEGGVHHSWEADESLPHGNIVFEVQLSVKDERSTLRSFDQGNIKDTGDVRPLHIEDYFQAINTSPLDNSPEKLVTQPQGHSDGAVNLTNLCITPYYQMQKIEFASPGSTTRETASFHHIYVHDGEARIEWRDQTFDIKSGRSMFIPAACGKYILSSTTGGVILETTLPPIEDAPSE
ncbi:hypothetical protein KA012_02125 [Candidatus Woesebacteria bacterium]|nr:hypothetical protein [Candidatus Woesebacteria bacterium]